MGEWKAQISLRVRQALRAELEEFAARERRKLGNITELILEWAFEQLKTARLSPRHAQRFRANRRAWAWFQAQAPWYRRTATFWVESAKQQDTRLRRLATLINAAAAGRPVGPLDRTKYARRD